MNPLAIHSDRVPPETADVARTVGEQRQQEADEERRHLLGLFEQSPGFVCFLRGAELVFELANQAYFQLVGHRDILGKPARLALPEVEGQGFFELLENVHSSGEPFVGRAMKLQLQREAGSALTEVFVDFVYQPIRGVDGTVTGILAQGHDVTEIRIQQAQRESAELALQASEQRYRTLFDSIDDGYCLIEMILDARGTPVDYRFLEVNAAFVGQTGLANAVGKTARELVPELEAFWFEVYGRVAATGESMRLVNHAVTMNRWFEVYASRVGAPEQHHVGLVFKDITQRKHDDEEREQLLARESGARHLAEEATRLRDEFLATVSHELRTPLAAILGWVQMLRSNSLSPEKSARALETIERNARAQAQLIEDLLDVSSIIAGKLRLDVEQVEVDAIVEAALETLRPAADAKGLRIQATLASGGTVMGDPHRLQQVVWNLLANAVKFTPRGGRVQVLVECANSSVEITVGDTGQGIAPEFLPHLFERFRQAEGSSSRSHGGLGLGLSIVRHLVDLHGGTVSAFSGGKDRGSSFSVRLPVAVARLRPPTSARALLAEAKSFATPPELVGLQVLVVDDEADTREMLQTMLTTSGMHVRAAASAAEALRLFTAQPPHVLVSDIGMPEEDGYTLIGRVRALTPEAGGEVPAVALTAYARSQDRTRALLAGFSNHVAKPVEPIELLAVLASLARSRKRS